MRRDPVYILIAIFTFLAFNACSVEKKMPPELSAAIDSIGVKWVPDHRVGVFDLSSEYHSGIWHITAETNIPEAKQDLDEAINRMLPAGEREVKIDLLPAVELGDSVYAIVKVSVANMRKTPGHSSEMIDQAVSGTVIRLLKKKRYWYLVQTPTGYLGWMSEGSFVRLNAKGLEEWEQAPKIQVNFNYAQVFNRPDEMSTVLSDAVLGSVFRYLSTRPGWTGIILPDGMEGYIKTSLLRTYKPSDISGKPNEEGVVRRARSLLGIPYLWGGNSSKAFDCSGFTGTVFRIEGRQLPRDANMQAELGKQIVPDSSYSNIEPGDLIFFGSPERVSHVGICLGGSYFIHCSDDVHINSLDEADPLFNAYRKRTFRFIKRL